MVSSYGGYNQLRSIKFPYKMKKLSLMLVVLVLAMSCYAQNAEIDDYTKDIQLNPYSARAYYHRGNARHKIQDTIGAIADYTKALEIDSTLKKAYYNRGNAQYELRKYTGAIADYTRANALDTSYPIPHFKVGIAR